MEFTLHLCCKQLPVWQKLAGRSSWDQLKPVTMYKNGCTTKTLFQKNFFRHECTKKALSKNHVAVLHTRETKPLYYSRLFFPKGSEWPFRLVVVVRQSMFHLCNATDFPALDCSQWNIHTYQFCRPCSYSCKHELKLHPTATEIMRSTNAIFSHLFQPQLRAPFCRQIWSPCCHFSFLQKISSVFLSGLNIF